jgi:hypothetical protein
MKVEIPVILLTNRADELKRLMLWPERAMPEIKEISFQGEIPHKR